jgi:mono/diheme cytochrome c family protein
MGQRQARLTTLFLAAIMWIVFPLFGAADSASSLYDQKCSSCHAKDGSGKTAAGKKMDTPDLRSKEFVVMSDSQMFESIGRGTKHRKYPHSYLYTGLNQQQISDLVTYVRNLQQKKK